MEHWNQLPHITPYDKPINFDMIAQQIDISNCLAVREYSPHSDPLPTMEEWVSKAVDFMLWNLNASVSESMATVQVVLASDCSNKNSSSGWGILTGRSGGRSCNSGSNRQYSPKIVSCSLELSWQLFSNGMVFWNQQTEILKKEGQSGLQFLQNGKAASTNKEWTTEEEEELIKLDAEPMSMKETALICLKIQQ